MDRKTERRFWAKVHKTDKCWEWTACKNSTGYGQIRIDGQAVLAHRLSWEMAHGQEIPPNMYICHSCDNPGCVRPDHLFLGTPSENLYDSSSKDRNHPHRGEDNIWAKLTNAQVIEIRDLGQIGWSSRRIGRRYNISHTTVLAILRGERYVG